MPTNFPGSLDSFIDPLPANPLNSPSHSGQHSNANDTLAAIEKLFVGPALYNVLGYGAAGDGGTDDATAINAALSAGAGNTVFFPPGRTYVTGAALNVQSGTTIIAYGATIKKKHGVTNMPAVLLIGEGIGNVHIYGGVWDGDRFNDTIANPNYHYVNYSGIRMQGCHDVWIKDAVVRNNYSHGFFMGGQVDQTQVTRRIWLTDCEAYGNMDGGFAGRPGCINLTLTTCRGHDNQSSGMQFIRSNKINIVGGQVWRNGPDYANEGDGFDTQGAWDVTVTGLQAWGNSRCGIGILDTVEGGPGSGYTWEGAWVAATSTYVKGQVVTYYGESYIALQAVPAGTPPIIETNFPDSDPYWRLCPYDSGASNYQNGSLVANERWSQNVKLVSCQSLRNAVYANKGVYNSGTTYSYTDSVYSNTTGAESSALDVYTCKVASSTNVNPSYTTVAAGSNGTNVSTFAGAGTLNVLAATGSGIGFSSPGTITVQTTGGSGSAVITYTGVTATTFTGCTTTSGSGTLFTGGSVNTLNWTLSTSGTGLSDGQGFLIQGSNGVTIDDCEASYNGQGAGEGTGFAISFTVQRLVIRNARGVGNNGYNLRSTQPDRVDTTPIELDNCIFDSTSTGLIAVELQQSANITGGSIGYATQWNVVLQLDQLPNPSTPIYNFDDVTFVDAGSAGYPDIQANGPASGVTATVNILRCKFPNSATSGNCYAELNGSGTTTTYIDQCGFGTVSRATITDLNFNNKFNYAGSACGVNNYALTGSSGVRGVNLPLAQTGNYTLLGIDTWVVFTISGATTATLPSAATCRLGKRYTVTNANASSASLTLAASAGTVPTSSIAAGSAVTVISDGTNWQRAA